MSLLYTHAREFQLRIDLTLSMRMPYQTNWPDKMDAEVVQFDKMIINA